MGGAGLLNFRKIPSFVFLDKMIDSHRKYRVRRKESRRIGICLLFELCFECGFIVVPCYVYYF